MKVDARSRSDPLKLRNSRISGENSSAIPLPANAWFPELASTTASTQVDIPRGCEPAGILRCRDKGRLS